jgi:energy-coupling factor transporter ATP-binding protein EcfA2
MGLPTNPLSPSHWTPETIRYRNARAAGGLDPEALLRTFQNAQWHGVLVGPNGAGKSTLLAELGRVLEARGHTVLRARISDEQRIPRSVLRLFVLAAPGRIALVDSAERLPPWVLSILAVLLRWRRCGLILTAHQPLTLPLLASCPQIPVNADPEELTAIIREEVGPFLKTDWPSVQLVTQLLEQHQGNSREVLADLYRRLEGGDTSES